MAMIWRMRLRLAPALGQVLGRDGAFERQPRSVEQPDEQRDHHPADGPHQADVQAGAGKAAEGLKQQPIAAGEQQQDRHHTQGKNVWNVARIGRRRCGGSKVPSAGRRQT